MFQIVNFTNEFFRSFFFLFWIYFFTLWDNREKKLTKIDTVNKLKMIYKIVLNGAKFSKKENVLRCVTQFNGKTEVDWTRARHRMWLNVHVSKNHIGRSSTHFVAYTLLLSLKRPVICVYMDVLLRVNRAIHTHKQTSDERSCYQRYF